MIQSFKQTFATWLYKHWVNPDIRSITREMLRIVDPTMNFAKIKEHERKDFLEQCNQIFKNPVFKKVLDSLINSQKDEIVKNVETEKQILAARGSIVGVEMVYRQFELYQSEFESQKEKKTYNKHDIIKSQF